MSASGLAPGKIVLAEYGLDLAEMCVLLLVAEPDFFAVRQEDERDIELIGIASALGFAGAQIDAGALGFEHRERAALTIKQRVIGLAAVIERVLETHAAAIGQLPLGVLQKLVDFDPGEGFVRQVASALNRLAWF